MSHADKSALWQELKAAGVKFDRQYREYTTEELQVAADKLHEIQAAGEGLEQAEVNPELEDQPDISWAEYQEALGEQVTLPDSYVETAAAAAREYREAPAIPPIDELKRQHDEMLRQEASRPQAPPPEFKPDTDAGIRQNTTGTREVLGVDEHGFAWYQYEIRKPSFPQPRKRRVLKYIDTGTKIQTVQNGKFIETFEVAGDERRESEARITLPSYQVGIYKDPRFPFKIHVYNENRGFDLFEIQDFYGGPDLVPMEIKRIYIENVLCYDIRTTVRAIEAEARRLDLTKGIR